MEKNDEAKITICIAPPGLYAVIQNTKAMESDSLLSIQVATAFKYTPNGGRSDKIFSEPLVYCQDKKTNALVDGNLQIVFVGTLENCVLKKKEKVSSYYTDKITQANKT